MRSQIDWAVTYYIQNKPELLRIGGQCTEKNLRTPYECYKAFGMKPAPTESEKLIYNKWKRTFESWKKKYANYFKEEVKKAEV